MLKLMLNLKKIKAMLKLAQQRPIYLRIVLNTSIRLILMNLNII